jgi:hypothetical protein
MTLERVVAPAVGRHTERLQPEEFGAEWGLPIDVPSEDAIVRQQASKPGHWEALCSGQAKPSRQRSMLAALHEVDVAAALACLDFMLSDGSDARPEQRLASGDIIILGLQGSTLAVRARVPLEVRRETIRPCPPVSEVYGPALTALTPEIASIPAPVGPGAPRHDMGATREWAAP